VGDSMTGVKSLGHTLYTKFSLYSYHDFFIWCVWL